MAGTSWLNSELRLLGKKPDAEVSQITGRSIEGVVGKRRKLRIPKIDSKVPRWTPDEDRLLGTAPDEEIGRRLGRTRIAVWARRMALGIRSKDVRGPKLTASENARLTRPDPNVLAELRPGEINIPRTQLSAEDQERLRLMHAPYHPPRVRPGQWVICEWRGLTQAGGYSDEALIPWPYARRTGYRSLILCGDLVRAVRLESEQAVAYHWEVSPTTVTKWRRALGVEENNRGTMRVKRRAARKTREPEIRLKISAARWGKPSTMSAAGRRRLLASQRKPKSKLHRDKLSEKWLRKYAAGYQSRTWSPQEDALLGTKPDREIALLLGRTVKAVAGRRFLLRSGRGKPRSP